ncbi:MAG: amino acid-binding protein [Lentisphaerae bacterium GWF2_52_8]|nr:MAG: amino acid-binding protein [Lentisphaerae bacterium GWF2_52_8]
MKLVQLSLFIENETGALAAPCRLLAEAGISISTLCLADTEEFGILRLLLRDWEKARELLDKAGFAVNTAEVLAMEVPDRPGGLAEVLEKLQTLSLNVEYMYAFTSGRDGKAIIIFRFEDVDGAITALQKEGLSPVSPVHLFDK